MQIYLWDILMAQKHNYLSYNSSCIHW